MISNFLKLILFLFVLLSTYLIAANYPPTVNNVSATAYIQSHLVVIQYNVSDPEADPLAINLKVSSDYGVTFLFAADNFGGDIGFPIMPGSQKQIMWYLTEGDINFLNDDISRFRVKIIADDLHDVDIQDVVNHVSSSRILSDLNFIEGVRHRDLGVAHLEETKDYIENRFETSGLYAYRQEFIYYYWGRQYNAANIIGRYPGHLDEGKTFIIDAHFDSAGETPGADDNGSGVVGVLESMEVLSNYNFAHSLKFIGFDLEEEEMEGSEIYVQEGIESYEQIEGAFNLEMIGYYLDEPYTQTIPSHWAGLFPDFYDDLVENEFRGNFIFNLSNINSDLLRNAYNTWGPVFVPELKILTFADEGNGSRAGDIRRSDNKNFWDYGYRAALLTDGANYRNPNYHQPSDLVSTLDISFITNVIKALVASVAKLADIKHMGIGISEDFVIDDTTPVVFNGANVSLNILNNQLVSFNESGEETAVDINILDLLEGGEITVQSFASKPVDPAGINGIIGEHRWVIVNDDLALNPGGSEIRIDHSLIPNFGDTDASTITIYKRDDVGSGIFQPLSTTLIGSELVAVTDGFSEFALGSFNDSTLPVELSAFTARIVDNQVVLKWTTESELNNMGFEIERSILPILSTDNKIFRMIGFVSGQGNMSTAYTYSFIDKSPLDGRHFYRLKQLDYDGQFSYSDNLEVDFSTTNYILYHNYPNPFNSATKIRFDLPGSEFVEIVIYNIAGQKIKTLLQDELSAGPHQIEFTTFEEPSGVYYYQIQAGNFRDVKKMILLK